MTSVDALFPFADLAGYWWIPLTAALLDALIGDPPRWPHPVRAIGALCAGVEPRVRRLPVPKRLAGGFAVVIVLLAVWTAARLALLAPGFWGLVIAVYLAFSGLALGQLLREGRNALRLLRNNDLEGARSAIGMLVSRDVSTAGPDALHRALAESLAENLNDAFVAPYFWLLLGGPAGLWLYKAASTMDSMWGYPYGRWARFGTAAARLDDVLAFIPARLTALLLYGAAVLRRKGSWPENGLGRSSWPGVSRVAQDARTMKSPNAGWPMAACAWIHNAAMGGTAVYAGTPVEKPILGPRDMPWTIARLESLCGTLARAGFGGALCMTCVAVLCRVLAR